MEQIIRFSLLTGLLVSALAAIGYAVWILIGQAIPVRWYWGGAIAAFLGPVSFAAAAYLNELRVRMTSPADSGRRADA
jgi:hypothetical protein